MRKFALLGAAALTVTALASPAMAQQVIYNPGYCAQFYPNANCQNLGPGNPYTDGFGQRVGYRSGQAYPDYRNSNARWNDDRWERRDSGFWPGEVAAGAVAGAVGTAGGIATAPFRGAYAYDNGERGYHSGYAARNGFVCEPGSWFKGEDGRAHICQ